MVRPSFGRRRPPLQPIVLALLLLAGGCGDDDKPLAPNPPGPPGPAPLKVLILEDGRTEDGVEPILSAAGHVVTMGGNWWENDGALFADQDVIVFLCGYEYSYVMPDSVQDKLVSFVAGGGGLLTTEWLGYLVAFTTNVDRLGPILPARYSGESSGPETYTQAAPLHPIAAGLPNSFEVPSEWSFGITAAVADTAHHAVTVIRGSTSGDAVVAGVHGSGRVVHWNMAGTYRGTNIWTTEVSTLLYNIVAYLGGD